MGYLINKDLMYHLAKEPSLEGNLVGELVTMEHKRDETGTKN